MRRCFPGGRPLLAPAVALALLAGCSTAPRPVAPEPDPTPHRPVPPPAETPVDPEKEVVVSLDQGERADLSARAREDLEKAEEILKDADRTDWTPDQGDRLAAVLEMMASARAAYDDQDYEAAATLARKARLLATELTGG